MPPRRRARRPWSPTAAGPYRLPRAVDDRLTAALTGFRNRDAAYALAVFLGRYWSTPSRLTAAFAIDRRALANHPALGLTEARVRGAIATLEELGFLNREEPPPGKRYQRTVDGLQRRPITFRFGSEYGATFAKANARAEAARGARRVAPRPLPPPAPPRQLAAPQAIRPQVAQMEILGGAVLHMGEQQSVVPSSSLEAALERLRRAGGF
ncbi:MAG: hypothetical protein K2X71_12485 [Methylobacterium sp.]|nr:hypothetical protein [Methylobacterium sp.]